MEVGHAITRDIPPSGMSWSRWKLFPHRFGAYQAIRLLLYWKILLGEEKYLRVKNVVTGETLEDFPLSIAYAPTGEVGRRVQHGRRSVDTDQPADPGQDTPSRPA